MRAGGRLILTAWSDTADVQLGSAFAPMRKPAVSPGSVSPTGFIARFRVLPLIEAT